MGDDPQPGYLARTIRPPEMGRRDSHVCPATRLRLIEGGFFVPIHYEPRNTVDENNNEKSVYPIYMHDAALYGFVRRIRGVRKGAGPAGD